MKKKLKKGFTLVELVIVIAVIAILSAVLIPTFGNVIQNANDSAAFSTASNALTKYTTSMAEAQQPTDLPNGYVIVFKKDVSIKPGVALTPTQVADVYVFRFESGSLKQKKEVDSSSVAYTYSVDVKNVVDLTKIYVSTSGEQKPLKIDAGKAYYFGMYMLDGSVVGSGDDASVKGRVLLLADAAGFTLKDGQ